MQSHLSPSEAAPPRSRRVSRDLRSAATPLSQLVCGALALFEGADLPASERAILASVGLQGGETLQVRQSGDSCVIQVGSTRLGLSGPAARRILVTPLSPGEDG
ncbi:MAG: FeoA domain-containing protein [Planctomycetota bacterium]